MPNRTSRAALLGAVLFLLAPRARASDPAAGPTLDARTIPKFVTRLLVPPPLPRSEDPAFDHRVAVARVEQQVLPEGFPRTPVFAYGAVEHPGALADGGSFVWPNHLEADAGVPLRVEWVNGLVDAKTGRFLPHLLSVDPTIAWANPTGRCEDGRRGTDCHGRDARAFEGPVPIVPHLHGGHTGPESDGHPSAWFLADATDLPSGTVRRGSTFSQVGGEPVADGRAVFEYPNEQAPATLWFHDHTLGMTRLNVYAGMAGFYLLRGEALKDASTGRDATLPDGEHELPLAIQDRSFDADGHLFYPRSRTFFDGFRGPTAPGSDVAPIWNPEFFGDAIVVNGRTWPYVDVEPRRYRLRVLNGCDARFLLLAARPEGGGEPLALWQIGGDGGLLPPVDHHDGRGPRTAVRIEKLLLGPGERADVILDLGGLAPGTRVRLVNLGPDEPFQGGDFQPADPDTTGQVLQLRVRPLRAEDRTTSPRELVSSEPAPLGGPDRTRRLSLNEESSSVLCVGPGPDGTVAPCEAGKDEEPFGPTEAKLGTLGDDGRPVALGVDAPVTEHVRLGATEDWEIYNLTADAHPIHVHQVQFQVLGRQALAMGKDGPVVPVRTEGDPRSPEPGEAGRKDTVVAYPGAVTRIRARFDVAGSYVWHCHILEHEDNEMMRPLVVE